MIEEKYKIAEKGLNIKSFRNLLDYILKKNMMQYFDVDPDQGSKKHIEDMSDEWRYINMSGDKSWNIEGVNPLKLSKEVKVK